MLFQQQQDFETVQKGFVALISYLNSLLLLWFIIVIVIIQPVIIIMMSLISVDFFSAYPDFWWAELEHRECDCFPSVKQQQQQ